MKAKTLSKEDVAFSMTISELASELSKKNKIIEEMNTMNATVALAYKEIETHLKTKHDNLYEKTLLLQEYESQLIKFESKLADKLSILEEKERFRIIKEDELANVEEGLRKAEERIAKRDKEIYAAEKELKSVISKLSKEKSSYVTKLKKFQKDSEALDKALKIKKSMLLEAETALKKNLHKKEKIGTEIVEAEKELVSTNTSREKSRFIFKEKQQEYSDLEAKYNSLKTSIETNQHEYIRIIKHIDEAEKRLQEIELYHHKKKTELSELERRYRAEESQYKGRIDDLVKSASKAKRELMIKSKAVEEEKLSLAKRHMEQEEKEFMISAASERDKKYLDEIRSKEKTLIQLKADIDQKDQELKEKESLLTEKENLLKAKQKEYLYEITHMGHRRKLIDDEIKQKQYVIDTLESSIKEKETILQKTSRGIVSEEKKIEEKEHEIQDYEKRFVKLREKKLALGIEVENLLEKKVVLESKIKASERAIADFNTRFREINEHFAKVSVDLSANSLKIKENREIQKKLEENLVEKTLLLESQQKNLRMSESELTALRREILEGQNRKRMVASDVKELESRKGSLNKEVDNAKVLLDTFSAKISLSSSEMSRMEDELKKTESRLEENKLLLARFTHEIDGKENFLAKSEMEGIAGNLEKIYAKIDFIKGLASLGEKSKTAMEYNGLKEAFDMLSEKEQKIVHPRIIDLVKEIEEKLK